MNDFMYKADGKTAWDAYFSSLPEDVVPLLLVDAIGPIVVTPAVLDASGNVVQEAVVDPAYHVNLRYVADDESVASALSDGGTNVDWINPDLVSTPARIWAGGMNYFRK